MESIGENSSCAGISLSEEKLKPLSAPPKLRRVSFGQTPRPTTSLNRVHPSPNKKTGTYSYLAMPVIASSECSIPIATPNLSNNMILQLMSNPLVFPGKIIPICQPVGTTPINQFQGSINIQSRAPLSIAPALCKPSNEILDSNGKKKRKLCRMDDCNEEAARRTPYCKDHCGQRKCEFTGCKKFAQGRTRFCIGHGGGRRCQFEGCTKGARDKSFCASHGGGKRCNVDGCNKLAVGKGSTCTAHGGGRRCQHESCSKSAQSSSNYCVRHGGGRKCRAANCSKVARGKLGLCMSHATKQEIKPN